jgi:hypothetical protein
MEWEKLPKDDVEFVRKNMMHCTAFSNAVVMYTIGRGICLTEEGFVGRVPLAAEVGDRVAVLYGAEVPFFLKECGNGMFKLVGECYIHGIMDGEFMRRDSIDSLSQDLVIC